MGLDVYLKKCPNHAEASRIEHDYEEQSETIWEEAAPGKKYEDMTEAEKETAQKKTEALRTKLGLGRYGEHPDVQTIGNDSAQYPNHLFKVGYFRSSYNDGGINSIFHRLGIPDLYAIFEHNDEYEFVPDWKRSLAKTQDAIDQLDTLIGSPMAQYDCLEIAPNLFTEPTIASKQEALAKFSEHLKEHQGAYCNRDGEFFLEGIKVFGFILGTSATFPRPCTYVIHQVFKDKDEDTPYGWYRQALEIVKETIEYVLAQPDCKDYYLTWSG